MPANLTPAYFEAEKKFRSAKNAAEKIAALEEMLAVMPKHKGTDHLRADLRSRISKLTQQTAKKSGAQRATMLIDKEGAAQVAMVGLPNSGKSQLLSSITNASPTVAEYPFTTSKATPGMMPFKDIKIQLIDTPPLVPQAIQWWLPTMLRQADALLVMIDLSDEPLSQMKTVVGQLKKMRIIIGSSTTENEPEGVLWPKKTLVIANKLDLDRDGQNRKALRDKYEGQLPVVAISAKEGTGLDELKQTVYRMLDIIRVYTKTPGKKADLSDPVILKKGGTLKEAAATIHKDFAEKMKYVRIWGSGKHAGIMARRDHILEDGDVIELHI